MKKLKIHHQIKFITMKISGQALINKPMRCCWLPAFKSSTMMTQPLVYAKKPAEN